MHTQSWCRSSTPRTFVRTRALQGFERFAGLVLDCACYKCAPFGTKKVAFCCGCLLQAKKCACEPRRLCVVTARKCPLAHCASLASLSNTHLSARATSARGFGCLFYCNGCAGTGGEFVDGANSLCYTTCTICTCSSSSSSRRVCILTALPRDRLEPAISGSSFKKPCRFAA